MREEIRVYTNDPHSDGIVPFTSIAARNASAVELNKLAA